MEALNTVLAPAALELLIPLPVASIQLFRPMDSAICHVASNHPGSSDQALSFLSHPRELIASICYWNKRPKKSIVSQPVKTRISGQPCGRSRT